VAVTIDYRVDHDLVDEVCRPYREAIERGEEPDLSALADELCRRCVVARVQARRDP
jgi:hypothetical protein